MKVIILIPLLSLCLAAQERISLTQAIEATLSTQPRLKSAEGQHQAAVARQEQAKWDRVGRFETAFQITPLQKSMLVGDSFEFRQTERYSFSANFNQPLWTWGALQRQHDATRVESDATRQMLGRTRQQLVFEATQAYTNALLSSEGLEVARQHTLQQGELLRLATARVKAGSAARLDELKAELALAQAESAEGEARNHALLAREALVSLTKEPRLRSCELVKIEDDFELGVPSIQPNPISGPASVAVDQALFQRLDLKALRLQANALGLNADAARSAGLPSVSLRASITQQHENSSQVFRRESQLYQVGLAFSWDATSGARSRARAAELKAQQRTVQENIRETESTIALEVRQAQSRLNEARDRTKVQRRAKSVAQEQARIARLAYREGTITGVEVHDAERALTEARYGELKVTADVLLAKASLNLALGK